MFGYPTGIGCLIVKHAALKDFRRPWFSGGTVEGVSVLATAHVLKDHHDGFHDGTINFLAMHPVECGVQFISNIGIDVIHRRVAALTTWLLDQMTSLRNRDAGRPLVKIAGIPMSTCSSGGGDTRRGGTIAFNLYDSNGIWINSEIVVMQALKRHIYLREGCFCNPGVAEAEFKLSKRTLCECFCQQDANSAKPERQQPPRSPSTASLSSLSSTRRTGLDHLFYYCKTHPRCCTHCCEGSGNRDPDS